MDLSPQDLAHLTGIERDVLSSLPLIDRITQLVDLFLDAGRRDEARVLYDAMATIRSIYQGTPQGMDLAGALRLMAEAASRIQAVAANSR
jgi:DNA transposition AAA+ family ATPase